MSDHALFAVGAGIAAFVTFGVISFSHSGGGLVWKHGMRLGMNARVCKLISKQYEALI